MHKKRYSQLQEALEASVAEHENPVLLFYEKKINQLKPENLKMRILNPVSVFVFTIFFAVLVSALAFSQAKQSIILQHESDTFVLTFSESDARFSGTASNDGLRKFYGSVSYIADKLQPGTDTKTRERFFTDNTFILEIRAKHDADDEVYDTAARTFFMLMEEEYNITFDRELYLGTQKELLIADESLLMKNTRAFETEDGVIKKVAVKNGRVSATGVTLGDVAKILSENMGVPVVFSGEFDSQIKFEMDLNKNIELVNKELKHQYGLKIQ